MKITYIHHSGVSVETEKSVLIFDYIKGQLPVFDDRKTLYVFASHFHEDHYSPVIFEQFKNREKVCFILSEDIKRRRMRSGITREGIRFVKPGEVFELEAESHEGKKPGSSIRIWTYKSTDEGVAFWVEADGKEIYHAGDLNNWWWEGEDKAWNHNMAANYRREVERIAADHPNGADAAFIPLDPRQEQWFYLGMDDFLKKVRAEAVFPIHFWEDYSVAERLKELPVSEPYREKIVEIHREGEEFNL